MSSTLVLILDNMGRQKALAALEVYREHEKFRKSLEQMQDSYVNIQLDPAGEELHDFPTRRDSFLVEQPPRAEESKANSKKKPRPANKIGMSKRETDKAETKAGKKKNTQIGYQVSAGIFREAFEEIMEETVALSHYVTNCYRSYKQNST